jgi:hypothetical protein
MAACALAGWWYQNHIRARFKKALQGRESGGVALGYGGRLCGASLGFSVDYTSNPMSPSFSTMYISIGIIELHQFFSLYMTELCPIAPGFGDDPPR